MQLQQLKVQGTPWRNRARWTAIQHNQGAVVGGLTDIAKGVGADAVEVGESVGGVAWHRVAELDQSRVQG